MSRLCTQSSQHRMVGVTEADIIGCADIRLFSIGHSNHRLEGLVSLLIQRRIEVVADVRTAPYSRYNPQFNSRNLRNGLKEASIQYIFLGKELGGRPDGDQFYDSEGHIDYGRMAETDWFRSGLDRLLDGVQRFRVALLCSEEDPTECHRFLLITRALRDEGVEVAHIRGNGAVHGTDEISAFDPVHKVTSLFGEEVRSSWRSTRSVSPRNRPKTSSNR